MALKDYGLRSMAVEEYIPWGGIVHPSVMRQKDGSLFSIIAYTPYKRTKEQDVSTIPFRRGWVLWNEHQQKADDLGRDFLIICWNPFYSMSKKYVENALKPDVDKDKTMDYFVTVVDELLEILRSVTNVSLLTYQDIMDVCSFALSWGDDHQPMPEVPLYMDALLSGNIDFDFQANDIFINGKQLFSVSILAGCDEDDIYKRLKHISFRHTKRLILFNEEEAHRDLYKKYTSRWFPSRNVLKTEALRGIMGVYNGYYTNQFQFLLDDDSKESFPAYFKRYLNQYGYSYIVEKFRLKECFWGSLPGLFLANTRPPIHGFPTLGDFLHAELIEQKKKPDILADAKQKLIDTPVDVASYLDDYEAPKKEENHVSP